MSDQVVAVAGPQGQSLGHCQRDAPSVNVGKLIVEIDKTDVRAVAVLDEAVNGIGLLMDDVSRIKTGTVLILICEGTPLKGTVKSILTRDDGRHRVGVEWKVNGKRSADH